MNSIRSMFKRIDLTEGKPWKVILLFAIPILFSLVLSSAFSLINALVLKTTVGGDSVSAVNSTGSISNIIFQFAYGVAGGFTIVISEQIGKKDYDKLKKIYYNAIFLCVGLGILMTCIGLIVYDDLLVLLNVNERYFDKAKAYYQIVLISFVFMLLNNYFQTSLRAMGDSFAPLVISISGTVINIALAFLFTGVIKLDTRGVAIATLLANLTCAISAYIYTIKKYKFLASEEKIKLEKKLCLKMLGLGIPLGIQWSVIFVGSFFQDSQVNKFGDGLATKAVSCYAPIQSYLCMPIFAITTAMTSYTGQNYGKKDFDRIKKGIKEMLVVHLILWLVTMCIGFILIDYVPYIFLPRKEVDHYIEGPIIKYYCSTYLKIVIPCLILQATLTLCRATLEGIQKTTMTLVSAIGELIARVCICAFIPSLINPTNPLSNESFLGICFSTPLAWIISVLVMGIGVIYYLRKEIKLHKEKAC